MSDVRQQLNAWLADAVAKALPGAGALAATLERPRDPAQGIFYRDLPGEGELPLWPVTRAVLANNPALTVELEVLSHELRGLPSAEAARRCRAARAATARSTPPAW